MKNGYHEQPSLHIVEEDVRIMHLYISEQSQDMACSSWLYKGPVN